MISSSSSERALSPLKPAVGRETGFQEKVVVKSEVLLVTDRHLGVGDNRIKNSCQNHAELEH